MSRNIKFVIVSISIFFLILLSFVIFLSTRPPAGITENIDWGISFSKPFAIQMDLNWKETYLAILEDLKPKLLRLPIYWNEVEPEDNNYDFGDYDWMIQEAEKRNISLILVVGRKLPRWPECYEPNWIYNQEAAIKNQKLLEHIKVVIEHYQNRENLHAWQVENEPFLPFGECPELNIDLLDEEIALVRLLDQEHPIITTDSGELSIWLKAAARADIFGTTMYRIVWSRYTGYVKYPLPPKFFWLKANLTRLFYPNKPIFVSELQAEPWGPKLLYEISLEEQNKSMNLEQFYKNIEYAKQVGFSPVYLWGSEWWYWLKIKHNQPEIWEAAKRLFRESS